MLARPRFPARVATAAPGPAQRVLKVPARYATIQVAIDAAKNTDTVLVAPGTYTENLDFKGKAITVKSSGGPRVTTIDGGKRGSVVTFKNGEGLASVIEGFTITNGSAPTTPSGILGGGIHTDAVSRPWMAFNVIDSNTAKSVGTAGASAAASGSGAVARSRVPPCRGTWRPADTRPAPVAARSARAARR